MRTSLSAIALATALSICASPSQAQTAEELLNDGKNTDNVAHLRHGLRPEALQPAQADQQVEREAARAGVEHDALERLLGEQAQPLVYNGVMYVINAAWTFAIDVGTGRQIWRTQVDYDPAAPRVVVLRRVEQRPARSTTASSSARRSTRTSSRST